MGLFFLSGFCGLVYQLVWTRLAFSYFGIITPVLSVILSTFMLGLALGSWLTGTYIRRWCGQTGTSPLVFYAIAELLIGAGALTVPKLFAIGQAWLLPTGDMNSGFFLVLSALVLSLSILPWCILMGSTFPAMMAFLNDLEPSETTTFSFLYTANVLGALAGTLMTAVALIEFFGFHTTLVIAGSLNGLVALLALTLGYGREKFVDGPRPTKPSAAVLHLDSGHLILFVTGFTGMALEVIWTRAFTMVLKTTIYSFALILAIYLLATCVGAICCRKIKLSNAAVLAALVVSVFIPIIVNDPRMAAHPLRVAASIFPLCGLLGYLTPSLIDQISKGDPSAAGRAYAFNTLGCIVGPLVASYGLLPYMGVRMAMIALSLPLLLLFLLHSREMKRPLAFLAGSLSLVLLYYALFVSLSYEEGFLLFYRHPVFRRDYTATVVSCGQGMRKQLFVNGIAMTNQTSSTKIMAHLSLGFLDKKPRSALTICFGMGTTFRSLLTWNIRATGVELIPSVKAAFPYYFDDAGEVLRNPLGRIVIDDGRRYLSRTTDLFDVIIIDPPPPVEAAGSSLLYSSEFYALARKHLSAQGILQQWLPGADQKTSEAVTRAIVQSFPYVKIFQTPGGYGYHFLASAAPMITPSADLLLSRLPPKAKADWLEWSDTKDLHGMAQQLLAGEVQPITFLSAHSSIIIRDDQPYNEYFLLRRWASGFLTFRRNRG
jgi:spermidine synthase